jgi:hydrogenase nickel incorporation protein HypA/HybF
MHELSIAEAVVAVARRHAAGRRVVAVDVRVGALRQVVPSALEFAFELVVQGSPLDGAELRIATTPASGRCEACGASVELDRFPFACHACGSVDLTLTGGEELLVESIEIDEDDELVTTGRKDDGYCDD